MEIIYSFHRVEVFRESGFICEILYLIMKSALTPKHVGLLISMHPDISGKELNNMFFQDGHLILQEKIKKTFGLTVLLKAQRFRFYQAGSGSLTEALL
jgi:hypothetical protein